MSKGNRTDLGSRVRDFFDRHPLGDYSALEVARDLGVSPNTVGQYLLTLTEGGELTRRMRGVARGRHYVYTKVPGVDIKLATPTGAQAPRFDLRDARVVQWADLPTWVKGGADRGDEALAYAKACTWLRANAESADEVFIMYGPDGEYVATWAQE